MSGPLAQFNHTLPNRESMFQLLQSLNRQLDADVRLDETALIDSFTSNWPSFEEKFREIRSGSGTSETTVRSQQDLTEEILLSVRNIKERLVKQEFSTRDWRKFLGPITVDDIDELIAEGHEVLGSGDYDVFYQYLRYVKGLRDDSLDPSTRSRLSEELSRLERVATIRKYRML